MKRNESLQAENDSLNVALSERDAELASIMLAFNEVQEGFRLINEAENRVDLQSGSLEGASDVDKIKENIRFITEKLQSNRDRIAELEARPKENARIVKKLKRKLRNLKNN
jgi:chromosome segregation ATPase